MEHESAPEKEIRSFTYSIESLSQIISAACVTRCCEAGVRVTNWSALYLTSLKEEQREYSITTWNAHTVVLSGNL